MRPISGFGKHLCVILQGILPGFVDFFTVEPNLIQKTNIANFREN